MLRRLDAMRQAAAGLEQQLEQGCPVMGRQEAEAALRRTRCWVETLEGAMQTLDPEERVIADWLFVYPQKGNVQRLCQALDMEQASVYRRRKRLLEKLEEALFGMDNSQ